MVILRNKTIFKGHTSPEHFSWGETTNKLGSIFLYLRLELFISHSEFESTTEEGCRVGRVSKKVNIGGWGGW